MGGGLSFVLASSRSGSLSLESGIPLPLMNMSDENKLQRLLRDCSDILLLQQSVSGELLDSFLPLSHKF